MSKKAILSLVVVSLVAMLAAAGTMAWFTGSDTVTNVFTAGSLGVEIYENNGELPATGLSITDFVPGDTELKAVSFKNTGSSNGYLRVKVTPTWYNGSTATSLSIGNVAYQDSSKVTIVDNTNWIKIGDYYYYRHILAGGSTTVANLFDNVYFTPGSNDNAYQNKTLKIDVVADIIQVDNDAAKAASGWGVDPASFIPTT